MKIETVAKTIKKDFKKVDVLVNNAGIATGKTIDKLTYEDYKKIFDINFFGLVHMTQQFLKDMIKRNEGHIVNSDINGSLNIMRRYDKNVVPIVITNLRDNGCLNHPVRLTA